MNFLWNSENKKKVQTMKKNMKKIIFKKKFNLIKVNSKINN